MKIEQAASCLALAMKDMVDIDGVISISGNGTSKEGTKVHLNAELFKSLFETAEIVNRSSLECPIEVRKSLNGVMFFALLSNSERDELYPDICKDSV